MEATRNKGKLFFSSLSLFLSFSLSLFLSSVVYENNSGRKTRRNSKKKEKKTGIVTFPSTSFFLRRLQKKKKKKKSIETRWLVAWLFFIIIIFLNFNLPTSRTSYEYSPEKSWNNVINRFMILVVFFSWDVGEGPAAFKGTPAAISLWASTNHVPSTAHFQKPFKHARTRITT